MNFKKDVSCNLFCCLGKIFPPSNGADLTFIPGSTRKIVWSFTDDINSLSIRSWFFTPSDGGPKVGLARIFGDAGVQILNPSYEVAVEKPATLVLKNVNLTYNGTYQFLLAIAGTSDVVVYIAGKFFICVNWSLLLRERKKFLVSRLILIDWCTALPSILLCDLSLNLNHLFISVHTS